MATTRKKNKFTVNIAQGMTFKKATPGTYVFEDTTPGAPVRVLYVRKDAMPDGAPESVALTVVEV